MFAYMKKLLERPALYEETGAAFWDDEYISRQMLNAHLDPNVEGASRNLAFIERSAAWIGRGIPPRDYPALLDVGCGPGLYAERFATAGFQVTGVDFSKRSIRYAQNSASDKALAISYVCQNYLSLDVDRTFDAAVMIYCDYGALSAVNRQKVLTNIYRHLKPGGKLLLDVFSMVQYDNFQEKQTWEIHRGGGFWREEEYIMLNGCYKYAGNVTLEQISIIAAGGVEKYYLWTCYFTKEALINEMRAAGFKVCEVYGNVAGEPYDVASPTIAILLEK